MRRRVSRKDSLRWSRSGNRAAHLPQPEATAFRKLADTLRRKASPSDSLRSTAPDRVGMEHSASHFLTQQRPGISVLDVRPLRCVTGTDMLLSSWGCWRDIALSKAAHHAQREIVMV